MTMEKYFKENRNTVICYQQLRMVNLKIEESVDLLINKFNLIPTFIRALILLEFWIVDELIDNQNGRYQQNHKRDDVEQNHADHIIRTSNYKSVV